MHRRSLLAGIGAATLLPQVTWADASNPSFISAARRSDGSYHLCGLSEHGAVLFSVPLPDRGHAAAAHPDRPEVVAFARRPGRFALIIDCAAGREIARLIPPEDRHFYGHGVFSSDGRTLFTTENDLDTLDGRIGLWDAADQYRRIGDMPSGGIGPHDIARLPGTDTLVIANGGIATHPDSGRTALNPATMRSNLAYMDARGVVSDVIQLDPELRQNSIRHLDVRADGLVVAGMQWNGAAQESPPLVMVHRRGFEPDLLSGPHDHHRQMQGYVGSIAFLDAIDHIGATSPRGGVVQVFDTATGEFQGALRAEDACGLATSRSGRSVLTTGMGLTGHLDRLDLFDLRQTDWSWDNHLVVV